MHRRIVALTASRAKPFDRLPTPFDTIIPNATKIGEASEWVGQPATFRAKYTQQFAKVFEDLCQEIIQRTEWQSQRDSERSSELAKT